MLKLPNKLAILGLGLAAVLTPFSASAIDRVVTGFDGLSVTDPAALSDWNLFVKIYDSIALGNFEGEYFAGGAPNNTGSVSGLVTGEGGVDQPDPQLDFYSNYASAFINSPNTDHNEGYAVETIFYKEQIIDAGAVGETWNFSFNAKAGNLTANSEMVGFVKVLKSSDNSFVELANDDVNLTLIPAPWGPYSAQVTITAAMVGETIQFGFVSLAEANNSSANFIDNLCFTATNCDPVAGGPLVAFSDNLESYNAADPDVLGNAGYQVFGNVYDSGGVYKFGYGPFAAPNGGSAFSAVAAGQGGVDQGAQQLSIYNDYDCCSATTEGHFGTDLVESNVFQEQTIGLADVGTTWQLAFDAKIGDLVSPSTALAFIKTLDPSDALVDFVTVDMTSTPADWTNYSIQLAIDASKVGYTLQFGFLSVASSFTPSGVFYDNISWDTLTTTGCSPSGPDTDMDGITDNCDNCSADANPLQEDGDADGHGNICDGDFDQNCDTNFDDLTIFKAGFFTSDPVLDLINIDTLNTVNFDDLTELKGIFFTTPGPSGADQVPAPLCPPAP